MEKIVYIDKDNIIHLTQVSDSEQLLIKNFPSLPNEDLYNYTITYKSTFLEVRGELDLNKCYSKIMELNENISNGEKQYITAIEYILIKKDIPFNPYDLHGKMEKWRKEISDIKTLIDINSTTFNTYLI